MKSERGRETSREGQRERESTFVFVSVCAHLDWLLETSELAALQCSLIRLQCPPPPPHGNNID